MLFFNKLLNNRKFETMRSLIYRKYLEILTFILAVLFFSALFNMIYLKSSTKIQTENLKIQQPRDLSYKIKMQKILNCQDMILKMELLQYGEYWLFRNYIRGRYSTNIGCGESITYTTQGNYMYMKHIPTIVER